MQTRENGRAVLLKALVLTLDAQAKRETSRRSSRMQRHVGEVMIVQGDKCTRPEHPAHGGVMLCTVQCRPASACAKKSPPRGCTLKKQDKTREVMIVCTGLT